MTEQLKQRLLGTAVFIALAVIIVPELVKKPAAQEAGVVVEVPPQPEFELEKPLMTVALPKAEETSEVTDLADITPSVEPLSEGQLIDDMLPSSAEEEHMAQETTVVAMAEPNPLPAPESLTAPVAGSEIIDEISNEADDSIVAPTAQPAITDTPTARDVTSNEPAQTEEVVAAIKPVAVEQSSAAPVEVAQPAKSSPEIKLISLQRRAKSTSSQTKAWFVQAGSFKMRRNADLLRDRLLAYQFPVELTEIEINGDTLYRVQVGPYASKGETEQMRVRLQREAKVNGAVRRL